MEAKFTNSSFPNVVLKYSRQYEQNFHMNFWLHFLGHYNFIISSPKPLEVIF